jgi:uncharacterized repeat protein (TIGR01451 family)
MPLAGSTSLPDITGTVRVLTAACPGPLINTAATGAVTNGFTDTNSANNSSSVTVTVSCDANLSITKTNTVTSLIAGSTTSYLVTITNTGPASADGAIARDTPSSGLSCTVSNCTASGGSPVAACPLVANWPNLLSGAGVPIPSLPSGGSVRFTLSCNVTATGIP